MNPHLQEVEQMIRDDRPFGEIEDCIDGMPLSDDEKAALWLLAYGEQGRRERRKVVGQALTFAAQPTG